MAFYESKVRFCKRQKERLYNVLSLDDENLMQMHDGTLRPLVANFASNPVHLAITQALAEHGGSLLHPVQGRPWKVTKTKFGPSHMNVQQAVELMEPQPLPQHLWPLISPDNLWKLHKLVQEYTLGQQEQIVRDLGMQVPGSPAGPTSYPSPVQHQQAYQQQPQAMPSAVDLDQMPAWDSPGYQAPQPAAQAPNPYAQVQAPNPYAPTAQANPSPGHAEWGGRPTAAPTTNPYAPTAAAPSAREQPAPMQLRTPLAGDVQLPDGRERCFGQHDPGSNFCATCPPWIQTQCIPQTPAQVAPPQQGANSARLAELQAELAALKAQPAR